MRRFVSLAVLLFFTVPFGASMVGCGSKAITQFCNGGDSGPVVGQVKSLTLSPNYAVFGESVNFGQMGSPLNASAVDCKGNAVSVQKITYATTDMTFADINPGSGVVCGGTFNRNTGGGIPDYTTCTAPTTAAQTVSAKIIQDTVPSAAITAVSVASNVVTLTAANAFVAGEQVKFSNPTGPASFLDGQTLSVISATATAFTVNFTTANLASSADSGTARIPGTITFSGTNTFVPGQVLTFSGLTAPGFAALNGQSLPVASASNTAFTVNYPNDNLVSAPDSGMAVTSTLIALVTATANGATSNAIPVYIHPTVTSIVIGSPTISCGTDPDTSCCPVSTGAVTTAPAYTGTSCMSQGQTAQLTARAFNVDPTTNKATNITCSIGHLQYGAQNSAVLTIDQNGVATAQQPGSTIVTAAISTSGSGGAAGFFSTCPPESIQLTVAGSSATSATVNVNTNQPLTAIAKDTRGVTLTGVSLEFNSTTPTTIPAGSGSITPIFPGSATITAACQPPTCNAAPLSQVGYFGNGKPITSNGVQITAPGANATVLYMGSTQSQYLLPVDFSTNQSGSLIKLPYTPNSMVITDDGSTIYLGSTTALMSVTTSNNQVGLTSLTAPGTVLSVSPNGGTVVLTDPNRQTVSLVVGGTITTTTGGVGTSAQWSPDSHTVYITSPGNTTTGSSNELLVHSDYTGWSTIPTTASYVDVAVMVPSIGAFFATNTAITEARSYCSIATSVSGGNPPAVTSTYFPVANDTTTQTDRIAPTNDGNHILGATVATTPATLSDISVTLPTNANQPDGPQSCTFVPDGSTAATAPTIFNTGVTTHPLSGIAATAITDVLPASNSALAFVTYTGTSGLLPEYIPATGQVTNVTLSGGAVAPVAGVFSSDNDTFFAGTTGDNQVHLITVNGTTATDTSVIAPKLPDVNGNPSVPNLLVQRPKKATS